MTDPKQKAIEAARENTDLECREHNINVKTDTGEYTEEAQGIYDFYLSLEEMGADPESAL